MFSSLIGWIELGDVFLPCLVPSEMLSLCLLSIWNFQSGIRVSINFCQELLKFPFESLLPPGYVRDLKSAFNSVEEDDVIELTADEIQRQTKAQHLFADLTHDLASDALHCIYALE
jgi:hypothetical protein